MSFFKTLFSAGSNEDNEGGSYSGTESPRHCGVNTDGTPMLNEFIDVNGDPYGCPSSLCDSNDDFLNDDLMNSRDIFNDDEW